MKLLSLWLQQSTHCLRALTHHKPSFIFSSIRAISPTTYGWTTFSYKFSSAHLASETKEHKAARLAHEESITKLRRSWRLEYLDNQKKKAQRLEKKKEKIQREKQKREVQKKELKLRRAAIHAQDAQEQKSVKDAELHKAAQWRAAVSGIYAKLHQKREKQLLEESRTWIRPEDLELCIQKALDHSAPLYNQCSFPVAEEIKSLKYQR